MRSPNKSNVLNYLCTCKLRGETVSEMKHLQKTINNFCLQNNQQVVCRNIAVSPFFEDERNLAHGSWAVDVTGQDVHQPVRDGNRLDWLLSYLGGEIEGIADDFIRIRVMCHHKHGNATDHISCKS